MRLLCLFGWHRRSRGQATTDGPRIESACRDCGAPMHKERGKWVVSRAAAPARDERPEAER